MRIRAPVVILARLLGNRMGRRAGGLSQCQQSLSLNSGKEPHRGDGFCLGILLRPVCRSFSSNVNSTRNEPESANPETRPRAV
jgi:hypothetical protein